MRVPFSYLKASGGVVVPDITSLSVATGFNIGGTATQINGTGFTGATGATIGGVAVTSFVVVSDIAITCVTGAKKAGTYDVVVTGPGGSDTLTNGYVYTRYVKSLALTVLWEKNFTASPWVGSASAGSSGTRDATEATNPPAAASGAANFDGTNDRLGNATAIGTLLPKAGHLYWVVFSADTVAVASRHMFEDASGYLGPYVIDSGGAKVKTYSWDGAEKGNLHTISTTADTILLCRYDGTNVRSQVNSGSISSSAAGNYSVDTGTLKVGERWDLSAYYDGKIYEIGMLASAGTDGHFDNIKADVNLEYSMAL